MNKGHLWLAGAFLLGVMLSGKVRSLPGGNKLPSF